MKIGTSTFDTPVTIPDRDRDKHVYLIGQTGTGKSTLLEHMIAHDIAAGGGVVVIDPHGTLCEAVLRHVPRERDDHLIYLQPSRLATPLSFNPLHVVSSDDRATIAGNIVGGFVDFFGEAAVGDRSQQVLRNTLLALMETDPTATLLSAVRLLNDSDYREDVVLKVTDPLTRFYWDAIFSSYSDHDRSMVVSPITNKLDALFSYPAIRNTLSQPTSSVNLGRVIEDQQILLVNLAGLADGADSIFGALMVSALWNEMRRGKAHAPLDLYIDEFPRVATRAISTVLSEARKYKLRLTLGHQFWGQVSDEIKEAVYGNVGTLIALRCGVTDAPMIAKQFERTERQFLDLSNHIGWVRGVPPCSSVRFTTMPPRPPVRDNTTALIQNSLNHFGRPREKVEGHIRDLFNS